MSKIPRWGILLWMALCLFPCRAGAEAGEEEHFPPTGTVASKTHKFSPVQAKIQNTEKTDHGLIFEEPPAPESNGNLPELDNCLDLPLEKELPRIAIIIDDMGQHRKIDEELLDLDLNLTFSFLPHAPFTRGQAEQAWEKERDILVHMPMEPRDTKWDPGPGALYLDESLQDIAQAVEQNIILVPHAIGMNNHMGSKFTADRKAMHEVLTVLQQQGLFFVDSLTAPESKGADEARRMGIRTGRRHIFLDNIRSQKDVCRQLKRLVAYATKFGYGIGIGHPNSTTLSALKLCREILRNRVRIVGVHELVH